MLASANTPVTNAAAQRRPERAAPVQGGEFLTFALGAEEYGVDILKVQEIRGYEAVTRIANTPAFIKGVVNLRGVIVPVVDLRMKFGEPQPRYDQFTVVIVLNVLNRVIGVVVDGVSDVTQLTGEQIRPAPELGTMDARFVRGIGTIEQRMLILVDIEHLLSADDMQLFDRISRTT
ncbi:MAG: chemotaxis protein CheW [Betaproteobacteria bacterium]|nr:chemotaxis protein CheW [Betaproteobacteria bacterium]